ncbi:MAG: hypothetical protein OEZ48_00170 [Candidatus Bathyarchaeota archaeon]|nr:hypothetical protein [Candidatus Bathyarchaeota archaeon]
MQRCSVSLDFSLVRTVKAEHKKQLISFTVIVLVFMGAMLVYTVIAYFVGVLEKIHIAVNLGFIVLMIVFYILLRVVKKRTDLVNI